MTLTVTLFQSLLEIAASNELLDRAGRVPNRTVGDERREFKMDFGSAL
jgi:hypothetical protein